MRWPMSESIKCEICVQTMGYEYEVTERDTQFVLWACECGHKYLERRPGRDHVPQEGGALGLLAAAAQGK